jgi:hypothetical protein
MALKYKLLRVVCLGMALVGLSKTASAAIVVNDDFSAATHPTGFRSVASGLGIPYWLAKAGTSAIVSESGNNVLSVTGITTDSSPVVGLLPGTASLSNVGDTINLSIKFRFQNSPTSNNGNFRFGLNSSTGTPITGDGQTTTSDNDLGYYVQFGNAAQTTNNLFFNESGTLTSILSGLDRVNIAASAVPAAITDTVFHTATLILTRSSLTNIGLSLSIDGGTAVTGTTTTLYTSFDELSFSNGFQATNLNYSIDDVVLNASNFTAAIPEPSLIGLGVAGVLGCCAFRRRK